MLRLSSLIYVYKILNVDYMYQKKTQSLDTYSFPHEDLCVSYVFPNNSGFSIKSVSLIFENFAKQLQIWRYFDWTCDATCNYVCCTQLSNKPHLHPRHLGGGGGQGGCTPHFFLQPAFKKKSQIGKCSLNKWTGPTFGE